MTPPLLTPKKRIALLKALASPARIEVVEVLQIGGPATVSEISAQLGRAPDSLYHHLKQLEKAGIVERRGMKKGSGRSGAIYAMCEREVGADSGDDSTPDEREAMADLAGAILRLTERDMRTALTENWEAEPDFAGLNEFPYVQRTKAWLGPEEAQEAYGLIATTLEYMRARAVRLPEEHPNTRLFALTEVLSPVPAGRDRSESKP